MFSSLSECYSIFIHPLGGLSLSLWTLGCLAVYIQEKKYMCTLPVTLLFLISSFVSDNIINPSHFGFSKGKCTKYLYMLASYIPKYNH